jgi:hypothetical protein
MLECMSRLLDQAIARLRALPPARQDELAEVLLSLVEDEACAVRLTPAQAAEVRRRLANPEPPAPEAEAVARLP